MPKNIEIKARISDAEKLINLVRQLADNGPIEINQKDTFFNCSQGRLKLRELSSTQGQLIYYDRLDTNGPKESTYTIFETSEPEQLRLVLESSLGVKGHVRKKRFLYTCGATRIHIDEVDGLGSFVELEVVLDDAETVDDGQRIAEELMIRLEIEKSDLLEGAYIDMLPVIIP
jgi:predicted adenylyl cyclase CyaB